MKRRNRLSCVLCVLLAVLMLLACTGCKENEMVNIEPAPAEPEPTEPVYDGPQGYTMAVPFGDGFAACGTGGRVDLIALDGTVTKLDSGTTENLYAIYPEDEHLMVAGDRGTLLISNDGGKTFGKEDLGTKDNLYGAAVYHGTLYAAGQGGKVYRKSGDGWDTLQLDTTADLIGLASTDAALVAISAGTDLCFCFDDDENWDCQNYNEVYKGMYPEYAFTRVIPAGETVFVLGYPLNQPNMPLIMYSTMGDVWMHKEMMQINGEYVMGNENLRINDICFNIDQIVAAMDDGNLLSITNCVKCNESTKLEGVDSDLWATTVREEGVLVCGEDFFCRILDGRLIRQDKIQPEQAMDDINYNGAVLIDVREDDELAADGYIPGSIHIPLAEVEAKLPEVVPDYYTEIIFYCASGKRSQTATEKATEMGYATVYNLGGLGDWPYDIVKDEAPAEEVPEEIPEE